jgi:AsmA-like protein
MKGKWVKYTVGAIIAVVAAWMLFLGIAYFYVKTHKQKLINVVKDDIGKKISGEIGFSDLTVDFFQNFPNVSIDLANLSLHDSLFSIHKKELLHVQHVYMGFGIFSLFSRTKTLKYIKLSNGSIYLFADTAGNKNWHILKTQPGNNKPFNLEKIGLKNVNVIFQDKGKFKYFNVWFEKMKCSISSTGDNTRFEMNNRSILKISAFNTRMGSYLTGKRLIAKWDFSYDRAFKKISLHNQVARINGQPYRLTGNFFLGKDPHFDLAVETSNLPLKEAASIFPDRTKLKIDQFTLSKPLKSVKATVSGAMKYLSFPLVRVHFSVMDAALSISPANFERCSFNGFFTNEIDSAKPRDDFNSALQFTDVKGEWEKNKFDGNYVSFFNLIHPYLKCNIHFAFELAQLEKAIASRRLDFNSGDGDATIVYAGPVARTDTAYDLNGKITLRNADITYNPRSLNFKKTDVVLYFEKGNMILEKMNTSINDNDVRISGRVNNFLNFFKTDSSKAEFDWAIYSPRLDAGKLRSSLRRSSLTKKRTTYSFFDRLNNKIDKLFDDCNAYLTIRADKLIYKNFLATNVKGKVLLTNELIKLDNFSLSHAGGTIFLNASSKDHGRNSDINLRSKMQDVSVKELFSAFNNFGMQSLTSKNIDGNFSADINLVSMLDANNDLYKPANKGYVDFSLKNCRVVNFQPLMDIDNNFLQKRNLSDVSFAELKDRLELNGNDIYVHRMEISSTAVNMYVEGTYSLAGNTDLSIQVPLHGQNKDKDEAPKNKGVKAKTGMSIFLRAKDDKDGKLKFSYDPLGRFRSKK